MSKAKLKKHLLSLTKEQVVNIMFELYGASKEANAWLEFYLEPNSDAALPLNSEITKNHSTPHWRTISTRESNS